MCRPSCCHNHIRYCVIVLVETRVSLKSKHWQVRKWVWRNHFRLKVILDTILDFCLSYNVPLGWFFQFCRCCASIQQYSLWLFYWHWHIKCRIECSCQWCSNKVSEILANWTSKWACMYMEYISAESLMRYKILCSYTGTSLQKEWKKKNAKQLDNYSALIPNAFNLAALSSCH